MKMKSLFGMAACAALLSMSGASLALADDAMPMKDTMTMKPTMMHTMHHHHHHHHHHHKAMMAPKPMMDAPKS